MLVLLRDHESPQVTRVGILGCHRPRRVVQHREADGCLASVDRAKPCAGFEVGLRDRHRVGRNQPFLRRGDAQRAYRAHRVGGDLAQRHHCAVGAHPAFAF
jgi:hypothetical protein